MASRFLTDPLLRLKRSFYPERFLTGRIRNGDLFLSAFSPGRNLPLWPEQRISLFPSAPDQPDPIPIPREERIRLPFLLFWPFERTVSASLRLPASVTQAEKEAAIGAMIELQLPWPIEDTLLAWKADPMDPASHHAWAILKKDMEGALERIRATGFIPRWVLPESLCVLERFLPRTSGRRARLLAPSPLSGIIDSDGGRTLCLLGRDGHILGEGAFLQTQNDPEAREKRVVDILLSFLSEGHSLPETYLRSPEGSPASLLPTVSLTAGGEEGPPARSAWAILSSSSREDSTALSFLKGTLAWQGERQEQKAGVRVLAFLTFLLIVTLIMDASVHLSRVDHRLGEARAALDLAATRALPGHRIVEPVAQLTQELGSLDREKALLSQGPDIIRIMRDLTTSPPQGIHYELISLNVTRRFFTVSGKTDSFRSVDTLIKAFSATGHMRDLVIQSAGLDIDRKTVTFRVRGRHD